MGSICFPVSSFLLFGSSGAAGRRRAHRERDAARRSAALLDECRAEVARRLGAAREALRALFDLDVACGAAAAAQSHGLSVPRVMEARHGPLELSLHELFHPGIQLAQQSGGPAVVRNSLRLSAGGERVGVLTGANMSGKSSLIRAAALCVWLTQCGLPSAQAGSALSLVDAVFVRVGSSDDITRDRSSFLNEMSGVAALLRESAPMLCCLDELGRSTAPEDGAALCAALIRELGARDNALTLLSTHFSSLAALRGGGGGESGAETLPNTALWNLEVIVRDNQPPVFTHKLRTGPATHSLAFAVARLAGVPDRIVQDAERLKKKMHD